MKIFRFFISAFIVFSIQSSFAQTNEDNSNGFYLGITPGFAYNEIGDSRFGFKIGGIVYYNFDNNFINLSYNRLFGLNLSFNDNKNNSGNASFERIDLGFGHSFRLHSTHPLFKHICLTAESGISFSNISYFKDEYAEHDNSLTNLNSFGIPICLGLTSDWNNILFVGFEYKFQIIKSLKPYSELSTFLAFKVF
ncbi:MAG: hypothetical protein IT276_14565 [Ignavibacteriaceae bacterium]|nr:hypothetical protein [Ignavibacteriaceae bacterium]